MLCSRCHHARTIGRPCRRCLIEDSASVIEQMVHDGLSTPDIAAKLQVGEQLLREWLSGRGLRTPQCRRRAPADPAALPCRWCGRPRDDRPGRLCRRCRLEPTEEEVEALVAGQLANLPWWWEASGERYRIGLED